MIILQVGSYPHIALARRRCEAQFRAMSDVGESAGASIQVYEPVEHLKIWEDGTIRLTACTPEGRPVEMDAEQASGVADLLRRLSEPGLPEEPYEPDDSPYGALMHDVCVEWGFCGCIKNGRPLHVNFLIRRRGRSRPTSSWNGSFSPTISIPTPIPVAGPGTKRRSAAPS